MMHFKSLLIKSLFACVAVVGTLMLALIPATAYAGLDVTLICPATIVSGARLNLGLTLHKVSGDQFSTTFTKTALAIHVGDLRIIGPSAIPISVTLADAVPDPTPCGGSGESSCTYWDTETITNYVSTVLPRLQRGTFISVGVAVMDGSNKPIEDDWCNIEVQ